MCSNPTRKVAGVATSPYLIPTLSRDSFSDDSSKWVLNRDNPLHPLQPATTTRKKRKLARGIKQPAALPLPVVDPEQFPVVAAALELGAVITGISEDMALPEWVKPIHFFRE